MGSSTNHSVNQLDAHTWRIEEGIGAGRVYMYLLEGEREALLIDTGLGYKRLEKVVRRLTSLPVKVVNTHGHLDHISRNAYFNKVFLHHLEKEVEKESSDTVIRSQFISGILKEVGVADWFINSPIVRLLIRRLAKIKQGTSYQYMEEGYLFSLGNRNVEVILTPGHTPGSICLLDIERRWLYTGDTACAKGVLLSLKFSLTVEEYRMTIEKMKAFGSRYDIMLPAHHDRLLSKDILEEYLECIDLIYQGCAEEVLEVSAAGTAYRAVYKRISVAFDKNRIYKTGHNF